MDQADRLIGLIYEAALEPVRWPVVLRALAEATGSIDASLVVRRQHPDKTNGTFGAVAGTIFNPTLMPLYVDHYAKWDPLNVSAVPPTGTKVLSQALISDQDVARNPFFQELLIPNGGRYYGGWVVLNDGDLQIGLTLHQRSASINPGMLDRWRSVAHHICNAASLSARLAPKLTASDGFRAALDHAGVACVLVDKSSRLLDGSAAGFAALDVGGVLTIGTLGRLRLAVESENTRFHNLVSAACAGRHGGTMQIHCNGTVEATVMIVPTGVAAENPFNPDFERCALVFVQRQRAAIPVSPAHIRAASGCSEAEATVAVLLANGNTPAAIAKQRGTSIYTVRAQIRALLGASKTDSITQLVGWIARL